MSFHRGLKPLQIHGERSTNGLIRRGTSALVSPEPRLQALDTARLARMEFQVTRSSCLIPNPSPTILDFGPHTTHNVLAFAFAEVTCSPSVSATRRHQQPVPGSAIQAIG